jgi:hypothetical protein
LQIIVRPYHFVASFFSQEFPMISASRIVLCIGMMTLSGLFGLTPAPIDNAYAEWYVAGYGGISAPQSLKNVAMDAYGLTPFRIRHAVFPHLEHQPQTIAPLRRKGGLFFCG